MKKSLAVFRGGIVATERKKNSFVNGIVDVATKQVDEQELAKVEFANPSIEAFVFAFVRYLKKHILLLF